MSEQRPDKSGASHEEEATLEWFADLKDDSDDPELQPVDPSVTQAFKAVVDEADAAPSAEPLPGAPGDEQVPGERPAASEDEASDDTPLPPPPATPDPDLVRAMRDEAGGVPVPGLDEPHPAPGAPAPRSGASGPLAVPHGGSAAGRAPE
ncbi:phosphoribosylformylglycinamidine synthase subunit PurL, partial [Spirillospora sp. NPDC049652]